MSITADPGLAVARVPRLATTHDRVRVFRRLLEVLAEPGEIRDLAAVFADRTGDGCTLVAAPLLVLTDATTTIAAMPGDEAARADVEVVAAVTHAPVTVHSRSRFVLAHGAVDPSLVGELDRGTIETPQEATMLVLAVNTLGEGGQCLRLAGPGVDGRRDLDLDGPTAEFWSARAAAVHFPRGIDLLLVDRAGRVAGVPRTTRVEVLS